MGIDGARMGRFSAIVVCAAIALLMRGNAAVAQVRVQGIDVSRHQGTMSQQTWTDIHDVEGREFVFIRASRGGTTGVDHTEGGFPADNRTIETLSRRYDDPNFVQNIVRATTAGMFAGSYHFGRPDIPGNTGTDEATHFVQMAGAWMRPGYLMPVFDLEAGSSGLATFSIAFSDQIYALTGIRPAIYINGNHTNLLVASATATQLDQLAEPVVSDGPSVVGPRFPMLWNARYGYGNPPVSQTTPGYDIDNVPIDTGSPQNNGSFNSGYYGPWDDHGDSQPWAFWQYASVGRLQSYNNGANNLDFNVSHGDIEYVKNQLVPAVWMNNSNGDWSTLANWNSGQTPVAPLGPPTVPWCGSCPMGTTGQLTPAATGPLPEARLPGAAGSGPTSGQHDSVILERSGANVTVTVSTGTHNIRKLYMRESLNITGGSLTINYDPTYRADTSANVRHGGPISAQFSGPVTMSGGSLTAHTVLVDATQTITLTGGSLTFNKFNLASHNTTPAKIAVNGNVTINPLNNATATIASAAGGSTPGFVDLSGGTRSFNVGNGTAPIDLVVDVPIVNGGITKSGAGTMQLGGNNTFAGDVNVSAGTLRLGHASGLSSSAVVTVNTGATLDMNNVTDAIAGLLGDGAVTQGNAGLTIGAASGSLSYGGVITGAGTLTKTGASSQTFTGANSLGGINIDGGSLLFDNTNTTGAVNVNNGGTLSGTGAVSGAVTVHSGGSLVPAGLGDFDVGQLTLDAGSSLAINVSFNPFNSRVDVSDLLTINGGSVNIVDPNGFMSAGNYTIVDYGTRMGDVASLGTPIGPEGFNYSLVDTGSLIRLVVTDAPVGVAGDFNDDGIVNMSDFITWAKNRGTSNPLPNDDDLGGEIGDDHYNLWKNNFGRVFEGSGGGQGNGTVPEPSAVIFSILGICAFAWNRRGR